MKKEIICLILVEINEEVMKIFFVILFSAFIEIASGQVTDTSKHLKKTSPDSVVRYFTIPIARYAFGFNTFNTNTNRDQLLPKTLDHKVRLYWDPVYLKLAPFPVQSNYKEGWLSGAATLAAQALFPYRKIER